MLTIRLQRTGRKGHAQYRVVVQDARLTPTSGRVVYRLGSFNPHTKELIIDKEKADFYLSHGAQPSDRIARLFKKEGLKLPAWVKISEPVQREIRNRDKLRRNRPDEPEAEAKAEPEAPADDAKDAEAPQAAEAEKPAEDKPAADQSEAEPPQADAEAEAPKAD